MRLKTSPLLLATLMVMVGACVDAPTAATIADADNNILASSFDALAREASQQGDVERSQEFTWAALTVRGGIIPSKLEINRGGLFESYDAMVHAVTWTSPTAEQRAPTHRTLLAWRRVGGTLQTLMISSTADVAPVQNPLSLSLGAAINAPFAGAHVLYSERGDQSGTWVGVNGTTRIAATGAPTACTPANGASAPKGVSCVQQKFNVAFDVGVQAAVANSRLPNTQSAVVKIHANEQLLNGGKLILTCANPRSDKGC